MLKARGETLEADGGQAPATSEDELCAGLEGKRGATGRDLVDGSIAGVRTTCREVCPFDRCRERTASRAHDYCRSSGESAIRDAVAQSRIVDGGAGIRVR